MISNDLNNNHTYKKKPVTLITGFLRNYYFSLCLLYPVFNFIFQRNKEGKAKSAYSASGRMCGNKITSLIVGESVNNITKRSMPIPSPAVGGKPCSNARM